MIIKIFFEKEVASAEKRVGLFHKNCEKSHLAPGPKVINEVTIRTQKRVLIVENLLKKVNCMETFFRKKSFRKFFGYGVEKL